MDKTLNLVIYLPGYAGNFIRFILSLDDGTYPIHHKDTYYDVKIDRKKLYSYRNLFYKYKNWNDFEQSFISPIQKPLDLFLGQDTYNTTTISLHPGYKSERLGYYGYFKEYYDHVLSNLKINYLQVSLSEMYRPIIVDFLKNVTRNIWREIPYNSTEDLLSNQDFTNKYNPYTVNLDNFILGPETFVSEYVSLCDHLDMNVHLDSALELYNGWYSARRFTILLKEHGLK